MVEVVVVVMMLMVMNKENIVRVMVVAAGDVDAKT